MAPGSVYRAKSCTVIAASFVVAI